MGVPPPSCGQWASRGIQEYDYNHQIQYFVYCTIGYAWYYNVSNNSGWPRNKYVLGNSNLDKAASSLDTDNNKDHYTNHVDKSYVFLWFENVVSFYSWHKMLPRVLMLIVLRKPHFE